MRFETALRLMRKGEKVTQSHKKYKHLIIKNGELLSVEQGYETEVKTFEADDILAENWEVVDD